jgi:hypothetical protein
MACKTEANETPMTDDAFPETVDARTYPSAPFAVLGDRFTPPWTVAVLAESFVIRDADLRPLCYIYFSDLQHLSSNKTLTRDQAWQLATNISMISNLVRLAR